MNVLAQVGGVLGCAGLAALIAARDRRVRLVSLAVWGAGLAALAVSLAPEGHRLLPLAVAPAGAALCVAGAWLLLRWPYLVALLMLALIPARFPVDIGSDEARLLVPLYAVTLAQGAALAWQLIRGDGRFRELGPVALPLAALVMWMGLTIIWSGDVRKGAIVLGAFVLPFGLLAVAISRLSWRGRWLTWLLGVLASTAVVYALIGGYQWITGEVFWNPGLKVGNAYAPFFRVNSVFWDPSVYGRYLTVAILAALATLLLGRIASTPTVLLVGAIVVTWLGLLVSFSQSSLLALSVGVLVAASVAWGWRTSLVLVLAGAVFAALMLAIPQVRSEAVDKSQAGVNKITSGRSNLIGQGVRIGLDSPGDRGRCGRVSAEICKTSGDSRQRSTPHGLAHHSRDRVRGARRRWPARVPGRCHRSPRHDAPWARGRLYVSRVARGWNCARRDSRAQPVLRRVLRRPHDVGAVRSGRPRGPLAEERPTPGDAQRSVKSTRFFRARRVVWRVRRSVPRMARPLSRALPAFPCPHKPVLVIGCPRSGTSVLFQALLRSGALGSVQSEGHVLWDEFHHPRDRGWDSDALAATDVTPRERQYIYCAVRLFGGGRRFVDKTPESCFRVPYLDALFPDAMYVFLRQARG